MDSPIKLAIDELSKKTKQAPGWVPLMAVSYIAVDLLVHDETIAGISLSTHKELIAAAATLVFYLLGDVLDKALWKPLEPRRVDAARSIATDATGVQKDDGIYRVVKALATAAHKYDGSWIQLKNESAKFFRSGILPCLVAGIVLLARGTFEWAALALIAVPVLLVLYIQLKAAHICDLYALVGLLSQDRKKYVIADLPHDIGLFFWDGELTSSAYRRAKSVAIVVAVLT